MSSVATDVFDQQFFEDERLAHIGSLLSPRTEGTFATEEDAAKHVDNLLGTASHLFKVCREVDGVFFSPRTGPKGVRIDRVLFPLRPLLDLGWVEGIGGAVGVEIKKSNHPAFKLLNQASDYVESLWTLPSSGVQFRLNAVFVFPQFQHAGALTSIMANRCIGHLTDRAGQLMLCMNKSRVLEYWDGQWHVGKSSNIKCGKKVGSR
jgi:hypothetical protein